MKKYPSLLSLFLALILTAGLLTPTALAEETDGEFSVEAASVILVEGDTGEVLYEYNADEQRYPASLTKIMTGLLVVEAVERGQVSMESQVTLGNDIYTGIGMDGSTLDLKPEEILTVGDLLYAVLLPSANEACNALASAISGDIASFVAAMNDRAAELGMTSTHYANTHGYHSDDHYTTARDVSLLCREALSHPIFREVVSSASYTIPATNLHDARDLTDTNALVSNSVRGYRYQYAIGIKTGYTSKAGYCLASAAEKDHRTVISVLLGGKNWIANNEEIPDNYFTESRKVLEYGLNNFSSKVVLDQIEPIGTIPVTLCAEQDYVTVQPAGSLTATLPNDLDPALFDRDVTLPDTLQAPIQKGQVLGSIRISYQGKDYGTMDLVATSSLEQSRALYILDQARQLFSLLWVKLALLAVVLLILILILRRVFLGPSRRRRGRRSSPSVYRSTYRGRRR